MPLGERIKSEIQSSSFERVDEFLKLDVIDGLNQKNQIDAERFLHNTPEIQGAKLLIDLLKPKTRRMVERIANPPQRNFKNPLIEIARQIERIRGQEETPSEIAEVRFQLAGDRSKLEPAISLFGFIFGKTLAEIVEELNGGNGVICLKVDECLLSSNGPPPLRNSEPNENDEDIEDELVYSDIPIKITFVDKDGETFETIDSLFWKPENISLLAFFWLLISDDNSPVFKEMGGYHLSEEKQVENDWIESFIARITDLAEIKVNPIISDLRNSPEHSKLLEIRNQFKNDVRNNGLSTESINTYFDSWKKWLEDVRREFIPDGSSIPLIKSVLSMDSVSRGKNSKLVLPTHPLRLRWFGSYLSENKELLRRMLVKGAGFSARDGEKYLDWLENLSPHELPPVFLGDDSDILYSRGENYLFEEFSPLENDSTSLESDFSSIESICARINRYIDAHPYKKDGLSILLLLPTSDKLVADILDQLSKESLKGESRINMMIAAPKNRWEKIARAVENSKTIRRNVRQGGLFPSYDLTFIEYKRGCNLQNLSEYRFDIGLVLHMLNGTMQAQQNTEGIFPVPGTFNPLFDQTTHIVSSSDGATSITLKPQNPDTAIDTWSTLVVRSNRASPVSRSQTDNTDFVELRLNFDESASVFKLLHKICHWVVTLDRHISRKLIESVPAGSPDILSVMEGIGTNGLNTLIVSSSSGKELIVSRLVRKLKKLVIHREHHEEENFHHLATCIYHETRNYSPYLALNAMGISRITEEILGVVIARSVADQIIPLPSEPYRSAWISLDEHYDWFGGPSSIRADMCRFTFKMGEDGKVLLSIVSLEGKLRQIFDQHGITQVENTKQFFHDILATSNTTDARLNVDSRLWRENILNAFEACSDGAIIERLSEINDRDIEWNNIRQEFREGNYSLESENAVYSICLWDTNDEELIFNNEKEVIIVKSFRKHIFPIVSRDESHDIKKKYDNFLLMNKSIQNSNQNDQNEVEDDFKIDLEFSGEKTSTDQFSLNPEPVTRKKRMKKEDLMEIYNEILNCFSEHRISVSRANESDIPFIEGPASILFKIRPGTGIEPRKLYEKSESLKLKLKLEQEQNIRFEIDKGYVTIDVPKSVENRYFVNATELWSNWKRPDKNLVASIGEDHFGNIVEIDFSSSNSPHLLIGGTTGSGKSEALNTILYGLILNYSPEELRLLLIDPKGTELTGFENSPHIEGKIGWDDSDAISMLKRAVEEMQKRYLSFKETGVRSIIEYNSKFENNQRFPWWIIVLDEYADLTNDLSTKKEIEQELKRLAQKARAAGIHVIIATQKPSSDVISTNLRSNLPAQLALKVKSATESRVIMDDQGAETLNGKGDAFLKCDGKLIRVQCAKVNNDNL